LSMQEILSNGYVKFFTVWVLINILFVILRMYSVQKQTEEITE
jgi:hypothetical protein